MQRRTLNLQTNSPKNLIKGIWSKLKKNYIQPTGFQFILKNPYFKEETLSNSNYKIEVLDILGY